jgi:hypothetical protein
MYVKMNLRLTAARERSLATDSSQCVLCGTGSGVGSVGQKEISGLSPVEEWERAGTGTPRPELGAEIDVMVSAMVSGSIVSEDGEPFLHLP